MDDPIKSILGNCYNYTATVHTLLCFISLATYERISVPFSFGRRMSTSSQNRISPDNDVNPDIVIQLTPTVGLIVESKSSLPRNSEFWKNTVQQLIKYDNTLKGWWTNDEYIDNHNTIFLIEYARQNDFRKYLDELIGKDPSYRMTKLCVVSFVSDARREVNIIFEKRSGAVFDKDLSNKLERCVPIPIEKVKSTYGNIKFCDSKPEIEYLLSVMWNDIFNHLKQNSDFDKKGKYHLIEIDIQTLTSKLQKYYGCLAFKLRPNQAGLEEREVEYPTQSWVREALELLVEYDMAYKRSNNDYTVYFKHIGRTDLQEYFAKKRLKKIKKPDKIEKQLALFKKSQ